MQDGTVTDPGEPVQARERPSRRTSIEVRRLLLGAAHAQFAERGYPRTSTHDVAAAAGVNETLLFRHFRSKANLFDQAVLTPFTEIVTRALAQWDSERTCDEDAATRLRSLIAALRAGLDGRRGDVAAVIEARAHAPELRGAIDRLTDAVDEYLDGAPVVGLAGSSLPMPISAPGSVRTVLHVVLAMIMFGGDADVDTCDAAAAPPQVPRQPHGVDDVRRSLRAHAAAAFVEDGYKKTTVRGIAERAGVAESAIFRHFGTKADLFDEAVVAPIQADVEEFATRWTIGAAASSEADAAGFLAALHEFLVVRRRALLTVLTVSEFESGDPRVGHAIRRWTDLVIDAVDSAVAPITSPERDRRAAAADILAVTVGSAVLDDAAGPRNRALAEEIVRIVLASAPAQ